MPEGDEKQPPDHQRGRGHLAVAPLGPPSPGLSLGRLRARRAHLRFTWGGEATAESKNKQGQASDRRESVIQVRRSGRNSSEGLPFFGLDNGVHCTGAGRPRLGAWLCDHLSANHGRLAAGVASPLSPSGTVWCCPMLLGFAAPPCLPYNKRSFVALQKTARNCNRVDPKKTRCHRIDLVRRKAQGRGQEAQNTATDAGQLDRGSRVARRLRGDNPQVPNGSLWPFASAWPMVQSKHWRRNGSLAETNQGTAFARCRHHPRRWPQSKFEQDPWRGRRTPRNGGQCPSAHRQQQQASAATYKRPGRWRLRRWSKRDRTSRTLFRPSARILPR